MPGYLLMNDRAAPASFTSPHQPGRGRRRSASAELLADWYATPVFTVEREERLEELAATGRGPRRLIAAAVLAADLRRADRQARKAPVARKAPSRPVVIRRATPKTTAPPAPPPRTRAARPPAPKVAAPKVAVTPARLVRTRTAHQARLLNAPVDPVQRVADDAAWDRWAQSEAELGGHEGLGRLDEERRGARRRARQPEAAQSSAPRWRQRLAQTLDRVAEQEVARGARLERAVAARRSKGS